MASDSLVEMKTDSVCCTLNDYCETMITLFIVFSELIFSGTLLDYPQCRFFVAPASGMAPCRDPVFRSSVRTSARPSVRQHMRPP